MDTIELTVSHRGQSYPLSLLPDTTLEALQARLEELTSVPPPNQKLLYKGRRASGSGTDTIVQAGLKSGTKIQLLGSTAQELGELQDAESEYQRRERIMRERATKPQAKLRSTGPSPSSSSQYRFHRIEPLPHLPNPPAARALLTKLADDPAIRHVMRLHQFFVGVLTELAPHEQPHLLGLNQNAGQIIKLRLRTDAYDGFRTYKEVRRVLCHELTHNVWGDHDDNFKELNSKLNREVAEYEQSVASGSHTLSDSFGSAYIPSETEAHMLSQGGSFVLGGASGLSSSDTAEERRRRILEATMSRLRKEEEELEHSCGTAGPSQSP